MSPPILINLISIAPSPQSWYITVLCKVPCASSESPSLLKILLGSTPRESKSWWVWPSAFVSCSQVMVKLLWWPCLEKSLVIGYCDILPRSPTESFNLQGCFIHSFFFPTRNCAQLSRTPLSEIPDCPWQSLPSVISGSKRAQRCGWGGFSPHVPFPVPVPMWGWLCPLPSLIAAQYFP